MKNYTCKIWRDVGVICGVGLVMSGAFWLLLNTYYSERMPGEVKAWAPVFTFVVTAWFCIAHRLKNPPQE
ncbi:hypothetical protein PO883_27675 [Massilia sp. DJPM01]|uniref:hypothetical protein n=1 Tax=Massilia sp. DJPM01 TaxID=3024404 RepID=UPI00259E9E62|nr:hypothetical protein [Massilia sp. DJPM01]MDM5180967.1 hypothetical protein [Massilia sp. DJPM01]